MIPKKIGTKTISVVTGKSLLNGWFERPANEVSAPALGSALNISKARVYMEKLARGAIGSLCAACNDVQHVAQRTVIASSCYFDAGSFSIIPTIFERAMVVFSVRKLILPIWINNRDQFRQPNRELPEDLISDCAVWNLFHGSNQTSSLKDVEYKGKTYQIRNQFFPYLLSELREWDTPHDLSGQIRTAQDTFVANWLKGRTLSVEAQALLDAGRKVYQVFYKEWKNLNLRKFKIDYWDVGWYQIRNAMLDAKIGLVELNALKEAHTKLALKLRPKVYEYGFLDLDRDTYITEQDFRVELGNDGCVTKIVPPEN
jgi:hypothetical protein